MADLGGGIYVSRVDSDEFEPDDEAGGFAHMLFEDGDAMAGLWKPDPDLSRGYAASCAHAREDLTARAHRYPRGHPPERGAEGGSPRQPMAGTVSQ